MPEDLMPTAVAMPDEQGRSTAADATTAELAPLGRVVSEQTRTDPLPSGADASDISVPGEGLDLVSTSSSTSPSSASHISASRLAEDESSDRRDEVDGIAPDSSEVKSASERSAQSTGSKGCGVDSAATVKPKSRESRATKESLRASYIDLARRYSILERQYEEAADRRREIMDLRVAADEVILHGEPKENLQFGVIARQFEAIFDCLRSWTRFYHEYDETWAQDPLLIWKMPFAPVGREECHAALLHGLVETMTHRVFVPFGIGLPGVVDEFLSRVSMVLATTDEVPGDLSHVWRHIPFMAWRAEPSIMTQPASLARELAESMSTPLDHLAKPGVSAEKRRSELEAVLVLAFQLKGRMCEAEYRFEFEFMPQGSRYRFQPSGNKMLTDENELARRLKGRRGGRETLLIKTCSRPVLRAWNAPVHGEEAVASVSKGRVRCVHPDGSKELPDCTWGGEEDDSL